jgi:hypothetical protein
VDRGNEHRDDYLSAEWKSSYELADLAVFQLVFRVQTFAKGNCAMLRRCVDEILAKNTGATIVFESYRVSFGAF